MTTQPPPQPDPEGTRLLLNCASLALGYVATVAWHQFSEWLASDGVQPPVPDGQAQKVFAACARKMEAAAAGLGPPDGTGGT